MKKIKILMAVISIALLLTLFGSCTGTPDETTVENTEAVTEPVETANAIKLTDLSKYALVRPEEYSATSIALIANFYSSLKEKTQNNDIMIKTDFYKAGVAAYEMGEFEILIGNTNRPESKEFFKNMRVDDYGYALIGNKLVIGGLTEDSTQCALSIFADKVLKKIDLESGAFFSEDQNYLKTSTYNIDKLTVAGIPIEKYSIVYNKTNKMTEKDIANGIQSMISLSTGYLLNVYASSDVPTDLTNVLYIGMDDGKIVELKDNQACIKQVNGNLYFLGNDSTALRYAIADFTSLFADKKQETVEVSYKNDNNVLEFDRSKITAMSFNVLVSSRSDERTQRVITMVKNYLPDTVGFQEASPAWMTDLKKNLSATYACVGEGRDGGNSGEYNPIFYKKEIFNLIDSGTKWLSPTPGMVSKYSESSLNRIYTYALLERKSDGMKVMIINTHLDHKSEEARNKQILVLAEFVKNNMNYPMIITGDFNTTSNTTCYKSFISAGVSDSSNVAKEKTVGATFHSYGSANKIIDFVFVNAVKVSVTSYKVCNEQINGDWASDHHPVYIEYIPVP